jgi:hypothetical protein
MLPTLAGRQQRPAEPRELLQRLERQEVVVSSKLKCLLVVLALLAGCGGTVDVLRNVDPAYDFSGKRTYKWLNLPPDQLFPMETEDPAGLDQLIKATVDEELRYKDFQQAEEADYIVTYVVDASDRIVANKSPDTTDWDPTKDPTRYGAAVLAIDFIDAASNDRVWRGAALTDFRPGKGRKRVREIVQNILQEFPPK